MFSCIITCCKGRTCIVKLVSNIKAVISKRLCTPKEASSGKTPYVVLCFLVGREFL